MEEKKGNEEAYQEDYSTCLLMSEKMRRYKKFGLYVKVFARD